MTFFVRVGGKYRKPRVGPRGKGRMRGESIKRGKGWWFSDCGEDRESNKGAGNTRGVTGTVRVFKVARGGEVGKTSACRPEKMTEAVTYRRNRKEVRKGNGSGAEGAHEFTTGVVLSNLENGKEGGLGDIGEPDLGGIGEDGEADHVEDSVPRDELQATDGITEDTEGLNKAADTVGHGANMETPVKLGGEEDPKVTEGGGGSDAVGCGRTQG